MCVCDRSLALILNISGIPPARRLALCVSESGRFGRFLGRRLERQPNYFRRLPEQLLVVRPRERLRALGVTSALEPRNTKRPLPAKRSSWRDFVAFIGRRRFMRSSIVWVHRQDNKIRRGKQFDMHVHLLFVPNDPSKEFEPTPGQTASPSDRKHSKGVSSPRVGSILRRRFYPRSRAT